MGSFTQDMLDAVDILIDGKISKLDFDKTIRASIVELVDASIGRYRVKTQDSIYTAYSTNVNTTYKPGTEVYVEIPSNDYDKDPIIVGAVKKLGSNYIAPIDDEDRIVTLGANLIQGTPQNINFCSYNGSQTKSILSSSCTIEQNDLDLYKLQADSILLAANFKTNLPYEQQVGKGNYGIRLVCSFLDKSYTNPSSAHLIQREYIFDVYDMEGQPYNYLSGSRQVVVLDIDAKYLYKVDSITAFCKNFPKMASGKSADIWITDPEFYLVRKLTDEELNGTSLAITTPLGSYFSDKYSTRDLKAVVKIQGKIVNTEYQRINFYWFIKDTSITNGSRYYSDYAGAGWRALNEVTTVAEGTSIQPAGERITVNVSNCPIKTNIFKCVAIFQDRTNSTVLSAIGYLYNRQAEDFYIISSAGTNFAFNIGKTKLTCQHVKQSGVTYKYYWAYRADGGNLIPVSSNSQSINVEVSTANQFLEYECTLYSGTRYLGAAAVTLFNDSNPRGYNLVINNSSLVFKYNGFGVSPASNSPDEIDRLSIPALTFDIYNEFGQKIGLSDTEKIGKCNIKWIWPQDKYTLLTTTMQISDESYSDPNTNTTIVRRVISNQPQLTFGIKNQYDMSRTDNNISLEVDFSGQHLTATTNFTFTKEGELGTNGTKYIARIDEKDTNVEKVVVRNKKLYGIIVVDENNIRLVPGVSTAPFKVELWDGGVNPIYSSIASKTGYTTTWSIINNRKDNRVNLTINKNSGILTVNNQLALSTIIQARIDTTFLSPNARSYFATIPVDVIIDNDTAYIALVTGGYDHCMYETDGTRGNFKTKPFEFKLFKLIGNNGVAQAITSSQLSWSCSWGAPIIKTIANNNNFVTIEPPSVYDADLYKDNYITCKYGKHTIYLSIDFYRNRYGLSAMNDWDGNSIQINNEDGYIIAPQIGAGVKNPTNNTFTGITMGKVFYNGSEKVGLFGYGAGEQSIFLDAETGSATFGKSGAGQIYIDAASGEGTIQSGDYKTGSGLKIKFSSTGSGTEKGPYIRYGSGNFSVDANGYLTAKGGGSIAGWKISNTALTSPDNKTTIASSGDLRFNINNVFKIYSDGRFEAANNKFKVDATGNITATGGTLAGWSITDQYIRSKDGKTTLYATRDSETGTSQRIDVNNKFIVYVDGTFSAANGNFAVDRLGNITAKGGTIGGIIIDGQKSLHSSGKNSYNTQAAGFYLGADGKFGLSNGNHTRYLEWNGTDLTITGIINATEGTIGIGNNKWHIGGSDNPDIAWIYTKSKNMSGDNIYLGTDGLYFGSGNSRYLKYDNSGLKLQGGAIEGSSIKGGSIKVGKNHDLEGDSYYMLEVDDENAMIGDFVVTNYNGRYILESYDEETGIGPAPGNGKYYFWANWNDGSPALGVKQSNHGGIIEINGTVMTDIMFYPPGWSKAWSMEEMFNELYQEVDDLWDAIKKIPSGGGDEP